MSRKKRDNEFSKRTKRDAFVRAGGCCESCGARLSVGKFDYDHIIPHALGGGADLDNCAVLCKQCHNEKTSGKDWPAISKAIRIQDRERGIKKPRTIKAWRRFDGSPVYAGRDR